MEALLKIVLNEVIFMFSETFILHFFSIENSRISKFSQFNLRGCQVSGNWFHPMDPNTQRLMEKITLHLGLFASCRSSPSSFPSFPVFSDMSVSIRLLQVFNQPPQGSARCGRSKVHP
eukprot:TRINITY_DN4948_c0_g1_i2.p1 TRINITY_DN4948_c0_g1~~TRINITY_DN4948_c0_g1_i2.p1  ORF type:complete len:118 (-),score=9.44 TRINITY_DN4948_c0_g1_i2:611-964(-)